MGASGGKDTDRGCSIPFPGDVFRKYTEYDLLEHSLSKAARTKGGAGKFPDLADLKTLEEIGSFRKVEDTVSIKVAILQTSEVISLTGRAGFHVNSALKPQFLQLQVPATTEENVITYGNTCELILRASSDECPAVGVIVLRAEKERENVAQLIEDQLLHICHCGAVTLNVSVGQVMLESACDKMEVLRGGVHQSKDTHPQRADIS